MQAYRTFLVAIFTEQDKSYSVYTLYNHFDFTSFHLSDYTFAKFKFLCKHKFELGSSCITKKSLTESYLSRTNNLYPRCHLEFVNNHTLCRIPLISPATDACLTSQNTKFHMESFLAPSVVHLTSCFLPVSQHHRLSVGA